MIDPFGLLDYSECESADYLRQIRRELSDFHIEDRYATMIRNHGDGGPFDFRVNQPDDTFSIDGRRMSAPEFGNFVAGYGGNYAGGIHGDIAVAVAGVWYDLVDHVYGVGEFDFDADSRADINRGRDRARRERDGVLRPADCTCQ